MSERNWSVGVNNSQCYLDEADGFKSEVEAINWAIDQWGNDITINTDVDGIPMGHYFWTGKELKREGFYGGWEDVEHFKRG